MLDRHAPGGSKPKVGMPPGSGRSLSMVFWHVRHAQASSGRLGQPGRRERGVVPADRHERADPQLLQRRQAGVQPPVRVGGVLVRTVGLAREVRMIDPPWTWILDTSVMERGRASSIRLSRRRSKPSMIPTTSEREFRASIVAAEMTEFIPGAGPAPRRNQAIPTSGPAPDPATMPYHESRRRDAHGPHSVDPADDHARVTTGSQSQKRLQRSLVTADARSL